MKLAAAALAAALAACGGSQNGPADMVEADAWGDLDEAEADQEARLVTKPSPVIVRPAVYDRDADPQPKQRKQRYRGAKIDLDLKGADLHNVFRLLADVGGVNIVVSDQVRGTITMRLKRVPWDQALHAIVRAKELVLEQEDGLYLVMPKGAGR